MAKDDKLKFKGVFVADDLEKQALEFGENYKLKWRKPKRGWKIPIWRPPNTPPTQPH